MTGGIFAVLDDIAVMMDDVAVMSKVAVKKTAGILGDDLAVNAEKATGFKASRELPVLWAISKGSFINKVIILPLAFLLSAYAPWLIIPVLLIGGAYLSYEGVEKAHHLLFHRAKVSQHSDATGADNKEAPSREKEKIQSAIRTDFILSIEIIVIALGTVMEQPLATQVAVVTLVALLATVGVYGIVALIVRMDDAGFYLMRQVEQQKGLHAALTRQIGMLLVTSLPRVIRALTIIGTLAMLLVGGGMFTHNIEALHHLMEFLPSLLKDLLFGIAVGSVLLLLHFLFTWLKKKETLPNG